jgi:hypothetical protein
MYCAGRTATAPLQGGPHSTLYQYAVCCRRLRVNRQHAQYAHSVRRYTVCYVIATAPLQGGPELRLRLPQRRVPCQSGQDAARQVPGEAPAPPNRSTHGQYTPIHVQPIQGQTRRYMLIHAEPFQARPSGQYMRSLPSQAPAPGAPWQTSPPPSNGRRTPPHPDARCCRHIPCSMGSRPLLLAYSPIRL